MTDLRIVVDGEDAEDAADELSAILADGEITGAVSRSSADSVPDPRRKSIDLVALTAVILAIPGAVLSALDIVDHVRKRKKVTKLVDAAGRLRHEKRVSIFLVTPDGAKRSLDQLSADAVMEIAGALGQRQ
jgi:hypothetical protein